MVPTLAAGGALADCLRSLESQTFEPFEIVVVDNSGDGRVKAEGVRMRVIANQRNVGFGAAVNQAFRDSSAPFLATLNDDASAHPGWLAALVSATEQNPRAGMCASQVLMADSESSADLKALDSAGMLIAADGSSKQRGHGRPPGEFASSIETLLPSASAALYRRQMLEEVGLFDESFFLYCEDTDLGLRARWAGWDCLYAPQAVVEHRYSHSAGRASPLKAYYVERNRLALAIRNFPLPMLLRAPAVALARYFWHLVSLVAGRGKAAEFHKAGHGALILPFLALRAHLAVLIRLPRLLEERRSIRATRRVSPSDFRALLARHSIGTRQVAAL